MANGPVRGPVVLYGPALALTVLYKTPRPERRAQAGRCGTSGHLKLKIVLGPRLRSRLSLARLLDNA